MRLFAISLIALLASAQSDQSFAGTWKLNRERSEIRNLAAPPDTFLKVEQSGAALTLFASSQEDGASTISTYPLDRRTEKRQVGNITTSTMTKWEGAALLVSTLVSGPQNYTVMERWKRSRDGNTLTINRNIVRISGESESVLVYENPAAPMLARATRPEHVDVGSAVIPSAAQDTTENTSSEYKIEPGTRVLLRLVNAVNTKHTVVGDRVYLETAVPVFVNGHLVIPRGSYVSGTVIESQRAGRVKGKSALNLRFDSLTLPNGVTRDFRSRLGSADVSGNLDRSEGKIKGEGNKGGDARTVAKTTAAGAGIGTLAGAASGHAGMGAGIGAAAGAAAGLAGVLGSRGPDVVLPAGTTVELVLDRELRFTAAELRSRIQ
jgi:type IV secretion system protein VirB10